MVEAVIFDWFGTLANWADDSVSNYAQIFRAHGYEVDSAIVDAYHTRWDGVDHVEHSTSREAYRSWTRSRLAALVRECEVPEPEAEAVVNALAESDYFAPMAAFPEAAPVLEKIQRRGIAVGVCSNWGWDLDNFLEATGLLQFVDVSVTSARSGYRKPHPEIYKTTLAALAVHPADALFVGDSWGPDVLGPIGAGMSSVHICRAPAENLPDLVDGVHRITRLDQLLELRLLDHR